MLQSTLSFVCSTNTNSVYECDLQSRGGLKIFLVEFKFGGAFLIVFMTEFAEFFGQDGYPTVENSCSNLPNPQQN